VRLESIILQPADQSISGFVEDANEQPIASAVVKVYGPRLGSGYGQQLYGRMLTDAQGRFRFAGVCEEPLLIYAKSPWGLKHSGVTSAYGGNENIKVVLGQRLQLTPSLIGKTLPELKNLGINLSPANVDDKIVLICFFDMNQRPSRNCMLQLRKKTKELKAKDVAVVAVQTSKVDENKLNDWIKKNNILFPVGMVQSNEEKIHFTWGVRSLPWLILTDTENIVRAEGFSIAELGNKCQLIEGQ